MNVRAFIEANTDWTAPPHAPELRLRLAAEIYPIWRMTEEELARRGVPPPYWAFAWAGGQALARYLLDAPEAVRGKRVLDFGAGSGLGAIAAAKAGASEVRASDVDPFAIEAIRLNAAGNGVAVETVDRDVLDGGAPEHDVLLIGDMCYEAPLAGRVEAFARTRAAAGALVLLGDPGRAYRPASGLEELARYQVRTTRELEDLESRDTRVYRVTA